MWKILERKTMGQENDVGLMSKSKTGKYNLDLF